MCNKCSFFRSGSQNPIHLSIAKFATLAVSITYVSLARPPAVLAQGAAAVEITPFGGGYVPVSEMSVIHQPVCTADTITLGSPTGAVTPKAQSGWAVGGRITRWFTNGVGLEGSGSYSNTAFPTQICGANGYSSAHVVNVSARLLVRITGDASSLYALAGYGAFFHGGEAYRSLLETHTDFGGVLGLGARVPLGSRASVQVRAEDYIYHLTLQRTYTNELIPGGIIPGFHYHPLQNDFVLSIGVSGSIPTEREQSP
jgi:hypothetical protein